MKLSNVSYINICIFRSKTKGGIGLKSVTVHHYDAFSTIAGKGNPAGIVLSGQVFTDEEMRQIAKKVGFNDTAFLLPSEIADIKIRYFTPGHENDLCGHATMAMMYALRTKNLIPTKPVLLLETNVGVLPITIAQNSDQQLSITMEQARPQFKVYEGSRKELATILGIDDSELHSEFPIMYGSTGNWTLLIPIQSLETFNKMKPQTSKFPDVLTEMPTVSLHPFCLEAKQSGFHMHARHFPSPYSGTDEDPITGTASGVMGAYYATFIQRAETYKNTYTIEQGLEVGKEGKVDVHVVKTNNEDITISITGQAVYVKEIELLI